MGPLRYFRRRRERESAIPGALHEELAGAPPPAPEPFDDPVDSASSQGERPPAGPTAAVGLGELGSMIHHALKTGDIQVAQGESRTIDLSGDGIGDEIVGALRRHGLQPEGPGATEINAEDVPGLRDEIVRALEQAGIDVGQIRADEPAKPE